LQSEDKTVFSPVYFSPGGSTRKILFDSLEVINSNYTNDGLHKQPSWHKVHRNDYSVMNTWQKILKIFAPSFIIVGISFIFFKCIFLHGFVPSGSMEKTIMTGELLLSNRLAYVNEVPKRGDIIVFENNYKSLSEISSEEYLIKRVIGVPGDTIELYDGNVYLNGCLLKEWKYVQGNTYPLKLNSTRFVVPEGNVFCLGDNREASSDCRMWEYPFVPYDAIVAKAFLKYSFKDGFNSSFLDSENLVFTSEDFNFQERLYE